MFQANSFNALLILGLTFALFAMVFSSVGSVYTRKITKTINKIYISSSIGIGIIVFAVISILFDDHFAVVTMTRDNQDFLENFLASSTNFNMTESVDMQEYLQLDYGPLTNVSCLVEKLNQEMAASNYSLSTLLDLEDNCQAEMIPLIPVKNIWVKLLVVAICGTLQQFCLIGKKI